MDASTKPIKSPWTPSRLFWISLSSIPLFLVVAFASMGFWWVLAFDWDAAATPPLIAWVALGTYYLSLGASGLAVVASVVFGVVFLRRKVSGA